MPSPDESDIQLLESFLQDEDLARLEDIAQEFNIFEVLGAVSQEIRHSHFLSWLLDPSGNHGLVDHFLKRFLWKTTSLARERGIETISPIDVDTLDLTRVAVRQEWRGIDILLTSDEQRFVCAIENKIEASEHSDQLARYERTCTTEYPDYVHHLIFLSASGDEPSQQNWVSIGYDQVLEIAERVLAARQTSTSDEVALFLRHYTSMLRRHIVRESAVEELCQRIYSKHRQALDLLLEYRPDTQAELRRILEHLISEDPDFELDDRGSKASIHFGPRSWTSPQLRHSGTGSGRILTFMFLNRPDSLSLYLEIQPPGDPSAQAIRSRIHEVAAASSILKVPGKLYPQYCRIFRRDLLKRQDYEQPVEWLETQIKLRMEAFKKNDFPEIDKVIQGIRFA